MLAGEIIDDLPRTLDLVHSKLSSTSFSSIWWRICDAVLSKVRFSYESFPRFMSLSVSIIIPATQMGSLNVGLVGLFTLVLFLEFSVRRLLSK
ncbi:hypothetical protein CC78DRAFT_45238 [Lojkania enalia]|uniref:Uncharacterized protein n=1 Tax=Lojkania enalia TaxID=147567 RepID=A0A9P4K0S3_9PLEO|nr:hypothetical protein CC78DRAFT_45238 [Didymosphaeria enalia]